MRKYLILMLALAGYTISWAVSPAEMRFHCDQDTSKINDLLEKGLKSGLTTPNELMSFYADQLMGTPYVAHTLEGTPEMLTINIDQTDCTVFIETLAALSKTTMSRRSSWRDFANNLENIRYRNGHMDGYGSRLHYISEWIINNSARGNLKEVTADLPRSVYELKTIEFMTKNRSKYPALADDETFERIKNVEANFRSHRYPIIKKNSLQYRDMRNAFRDGDIIGITCTTPGLDVTHLGIIRYIDGIPHLLHASSAGMKVEISPLYIGEMLQRNKIHSGIRVFRLQE